MYVKTEIIIIMHEQIAGIGFMLWRTEPAESRCHIVRVFVTYVAGKRACSGWDPSMTTM